MRDRKSMIAHEDTRLVPVWSIMAAALVFVLVEYYFWVVFPGQQHHVPPLGLRIYLNLSWGLLASLYFLMVGFVSKDAPRHEPPVLDADLLCDARRHWGRALLPAPRAAGVPLPGLRHARAK